MPILIFETVINAAPEVCFDLVRDVSFFLQSGEKDFEKFAAKNSHGEIKLGEIVTFERKVFGLSQTLKVKVVELEKPLRFVDEMIEGNFKYFRHAHEFITAKNQTLMRDIFVWESPLGILGKIADAIFMKNYLRNMAMRRNAKLKEIAESDFYKLTHN
jgi:ligand-binding SRPBCC domain-containing protein